jgi:hypothetical protein
MLNDEYYQVELRVHPDEAIKFELVSLEPWPETPHLRRAIFDKALQLAVRAAKEGAKS